MLPILLRTTCLLAVAAIVAAGVLHVARPCSPRVHRVAWLLVLLAGWAFVRLPVEVPWYEPVAAVAPELPAVQPTVADRTVVGTPTIEIGPGAQVPVSAEELATLAPTPIVVESAVPSPPTDMLPIEGRAFDDIATASDWSPPHMLDTIPAPAPMPSVDLSVAAIAPPAPVDWQFYLCLAWIGGMVAIVVAWLAGYLVFIHRIARAAVPDTGPATIQDTAQAWHEQWQRLQAAQGVSRAIPLRVTAGVGPLLCRLPRGYLLAVPADLWRELDHDERETILRHELAHFQRGDLWKSLAARALALPHWFNPAGWWAVARFDEAAEWTCDAAAAGETQATTYAKALMRLGVSPQGPPEIHHYGTAARGRPLAARIRRILLHNDSGREDSAMKRTLLIALGVCLALVSLVRVELVAQQAEQAGEQAGGTNAAADGVNRNAGINGQIEIDERTFDPKRVLVERRESGQQFRLEADPPRAPERRVPPKSPLLVEVLQQMERALEEARKSGDVETARQLEEALLKERAVAAPEALRAVKEAQIEATEQEKSLGKIDVDEQAFDPARVPAEMWQALAEQRSGRAQQAERYAEAAQRAAANDPRQSGAQMAAAARQAYHALYDEQGGQRDLEALHMWSLRWMNAVGGSAPARQQAMVDHWERMKSLASSVTAAHAAGVKGGEPARVAAAEYYVAEAAQIIANNRFAALPAGPAVADGPVPPAVPSRQEEREKQAQAMRQEAAERATREQAGPTVSPDLNLLQQGQPAQADRAALRYDGHDFDYWKDSLRNELSPAKRAEAITAMAAFGSRGYGKEAATLILEARGSDPIDSNRVAPELRDAFAKAVNQISHPEMRAAILVGLSHANAAVRYYSLVGIKNLNLKDVLPELLGAMHDEEPIIRADAMIWASRLHADAKALRSALREAVSDSDDGVANIAARLVASSVNYVAASRNDGFAPSAVSLRAPISNQTIASLIVALKNPDEDFRAAAEAALLRQGHAAVEELTKATNAGDKRAQDILLKIQQVDDRQNRTNTPPPTRPNPILPTPPPGGRGRY